MSFRRSQRTSSNARCFGDSSKDELMTHATGKCVCGKKKPGQTKGPGGV